jgi:hypothetical protein
MIAARNAFLMSGAKTPTARDYVQSGLIAMWDGIENAGWGQHDANATVWKDLSNSGNDLNITAGTWAADHFVCNGASGGKSGFISNISTIEVVVKRTSSTSYQMIIGLRKVQYYDRYFAVSDGYVNFASWGPRLPITTGAVEAFACTFGDTVALYKYGAPATSAGTGDYFSAGNSTGVLLGVAGTGNYPFDGEIYAIRLNSRALTAAEVAANYAVDAARFGL